MKKLFFTLAILLSVMLTGCEQAIGFETETAPPKLVVDAAIVWQKGTAGNEQKIKLTTTTNYYNANPPVVSGATVYIKNSSDTTFDFLETPGTGEYVCSTFVPVIGETYTLTVIHDGRTLTATEMLYGVRPIDYVKQETIPGTGENQIEVKAYFTDPALTTDFYMLRFKSTVDVIPDFDVFDDEFFQGNQIFGLYQNEDLKPGHQLDVKIYGISERYMNYMNKLLNIVENSGPFGTPPATLRGNIVNTTNPNDFVLGYFFVSEMDTELYTIE